MRKHGHQKTFKSVKSDALRHRELCRKRKRSPFAKRVRRT